MKCQRSLENSLSKNMLENKEADDPNFSVQGLKDGLKAIGRNDLVLELENVPGKLWFAVCFWTREVGGSL